MPGIATWKAPVGTTKLIAFQYFFTFFLKKLKQAELISKTHFPGRKADFIFALEQIRRMRNRTPSNNTRKTP
jgi:hypothetical protein